MTQATYNELSALRTRLATQIEAIDILLGFQKPIKPTKRIEEIAAENSMILLREREELKPPTKVIAPASVRNPKKPARAKETPKFPWSKQDAIAFIINTIKVHNNVPLCVDEMIKFAPFEEKQRYEVQARLSTALTSMYYGEVLTRKKQPNATGKPCYHYYFP